MSVGLFRSEYCQPEIYPYLSGGKRRETLWKELHICVFFPMCEF